MTNQKNQTSVTLLADADSLACCFLHEGLLEDLVAEVTTPQGPLVCREQLLNFEFFAAAAVV